MDPITFGLAFGPPIIEGLFGARGQSSANAANAQQAREQMAFQERMRGTQYQTAVADIKAAGLNPALAYGQGGAGTPGGAAATIQNTLAGTKGTAQGAAATYASMTAAKNTEAQTRKVDAETNQINIESAARLKNLHAGTQLSTAQATAAHEQGRKTFYETNQMTTSFETRMEQLKQDVLKTIENVREARASATIRQHEIPGAEAQAKANRTIYGKKVRPYINDAKSLKQIL